jgi:hypothetical protein
MLPNSTATKSQCGTKRREPFAEARKANGAEYTRTQNLENKKKQHSLPSRIQQNKKSFNEKWKGKQP